MIMKALSIMQPWAWLIANSYKDIENRDWQPKNPGLRFRGEFLIHTGKKFDGKPEIWNWEAISEEVDMDIRPPDEWKLGGIVGIAEIVDVVRDHSSPWFFGPVGLVIRNARPLNFMPVRGQLGFFDVGYPNRFAA
jgi:hypothetical protein